MKIKLKLLLSACLLTLLGVLLLTSCEEKHVHEFGEWMKAREATCAEEGVLERYCYCLEKESQKIPSLAHTPAEHVPCNLNQRCVVCDTVLRAPTAHQYGEASVTPATCTKAGSKRMTCTVCGDVSMQVIFPTGHTFGAPVTVKEANCKEPGLQESFCACGEKKSETVTADHVGEWITVKAQTKSEDGVREKNCSYCHETITEILYATGSEGFSFLVNDDGKTCTVTGIGTCTDADVVIPAFLNGYKVTYIESQAFENCETMTSLQIPSTVTAIGNYIVRGAKNLRTLYYNTEYSHSLLSFRDSNIQKIVYGGTMVCCTLTQSVEEVVIRDTVTVIGEGAFYYCLYLKSVVIPDSVTQIGDNAFVFCRSLSHMELPDSITSIGDNAFADCSSLKSLRIPAGVTSIGVNAFSGTAMEEIILPETMTTIYGFTFYGCTALKKITLPGTLEEICDFVFRNCAALETVSFDGTTAQWENVEKGAYWKDGSALKKIICTDGTVELE